MDYMDKDMGKILKNNAQTLRHELLSQGTDCFRVYDRNLSRYPVTIDIYGKYAKITDYGDEALSDESRETLLDICSRMLYLEKDNLVYAVRNKRPDRQQHEKSNDEAVKTIVHENNLLFSVDLTTYVDTGLFLDHMKTRVLIRDRSENADVLNLFSYTGSFSVYAASGMANSVTSVDMSATYTKWAEENLLANGYSGDMYKCICMDATRFVDDALEKGLKYDIIIFDPPSFSNSRKMDGDFDVSRDYVAWIRKLCALLKKTGIILFSTNLGSFQMEKKKLRGLSIKEITTLVASPGFVKGRAGTVRSWMMAFDDESLSLDWSEPEKKSEKGSDRRRQAEGRPERRREGDRRRFSDRKPYQERRSGEKPYRSERRFDDDRSYRSERRFDDDRPYRSERSYDRPRRDDRPYRSDRSERSERNERSFGDRPSYGEQGRDHYRSRSYDRPFRSERSERSERPERSDRFERSERPRREHFDRGERRDERPRERSFDRDRSRAPRQDSHKTKKPFGYDSFKPARSREDSTDFFWNEEDLDPRKKD